MSFSELIDVGQDLSDILNLLGLSSGQSTQQEIEELAKDADALAVFTIRAIVAIFWWISHMSSATADALGYSQQMLDEMKTTNQYQLDTWKTFLSVKHPTEIRRVYIHTTKTVQVTKRIIQKQQAVNLAAIKKEIAALEAWKKNTVTPDLKKLMAFWHAWENQYKAPVVRWVSWFKQPKLFAQWAAMPLIAQLPITLKNASAQANATLIEAALVKTWQRDSGIIWGEVATWLVTDT